MKIYSATDPDGDTVVIDQFANTGGRWDYVLTVSGEDGHRAVVLTAAQLAALAAALTAAPADDTESALVIAQASAAAVYEYALDIGADTAAPMREYDRASSALIEHRVAMYARRPSFMWPTVVVKTPPAEIAAINARLALRPIPSVAGAIASADWGTVGGFDISAALVPDNDFGADAVVGFGHDVAAAYAAGEFCYVGVIVTASRAGVALGSDSIWGSEYGVIPGAGVVNPLTDSDYMYRADLIDNAVADARMRLAEITD